MNAQINVLLVAYAVTAASMLGGLLAMRADSRAYWRLPVYSAMVMVVGVVLWNVLRVHVFPARWSLSYGPALYYAALALYAVLGAGAGCGLGRLTRKTEMATQNES
jgi:Na+/glutamate symporter